MEKTPANDKRTSNAQKTSIGGQARLSSPACPPSLRSGVSRRAASANGGQALQGSEKVSIGGQAVIEGVMMRGKRNWVVAVRGKDNQIKTEERKINSLANRVHFFKWFILRGIGVLVDTLVLGIQALSFSAKEQARLPTSEAEGNGGQADEEVEITKKEMAFTLVLALLLVVGIFIVLPAFLVRTVDQYLKGTILLNLAEGVVRITIFVAYIYFVSRLKDMRRVFAYHGAEHKVVHAFEAGEELTPEVAAKYSRMHVACGTSFLLVVFVLSVFVFSFLGRPALIIRIVSRLLILPLVAGISYEIIKLARKYQDLGFIKILMAPGIWLQRLTTREPDASQLEVAIVSLKRLLALEGIKSKEEVEESMP